MNLIFGEIIELFDEDGSRMGKVRIHGVLKKLSLDLLTVPSVGDTVLLCEGVALNKVDQSAPREAIYVSGHSR